MMFVMHGKMSDQPLAILIGFGRWGKRLAKKIGFGNIDCIVVRSPVNHSQPTSVKFLSTEEELQNADLRYIVLATPIDTLYPLSRKFLSKNYPVFCEKPFTLSVDDLLSVRTYFLKKKLWVNYLYQFSQFVTETNLDLQKMTFKWKKFSDFRAVRQNLLPHELSLVVARLGQCRSFEMITPLCVDYKRLSCSFVYNGITVNIEIELISARMDDVKMCVTEYSNYYSTFDFQQEDVDKLELSLKAFRERNDEEYKRNYQIIFGVNHLYAKIAG